MTIPKKFLLTVTALLTGSGAALATPVDLSTWTATGGGNWNLESGNNSVLQTINGNPTFFYEPGTSAQGQALSGNITVTTTGDDDFIGFALGFDSSDITSASADYILIDWKQLAQGSPPFKGLAISHVSNSLDDTYGFNDYWTHSNGVTEIARGATLGSTGWLDNTTYEFDLQFTSSLIEVSVDGVQQFSITPADAGLTAFDDGAFAFYNFSQSHVRYGAIEEAQSSLVPESGATLALFGLALAGIGFGRRFFA